MTLRFVSAEELRDLVPMERAIVALERAFLAEDIEAPQRVRHETGRGDLLLMPAWGREHVGVKLVTVNPANAERNLPLIHGTYTLFDAQTMAPIASVDAEALTRIRTAAVSGLATRYLADPEAKRLVVFGAGTQAHGHVEAMRAVRPIAHVTIVARNRASAVHMAHRVRDDLGLSADPGPPEAVRDADIVCTCTTSSIPVFDGELLKERVHVNAIGSYTPEARELDDTTIRRAETIVVEQRDIAMREAGDLVIPLQRGTLSRGRVIEMKKLLSGKEGGRGVTIFKSVGMALEDLAIARLVAHP